MNLPPSSSPVPPKSLRNWWWCGYCHHSQPLHVVRQGIWRRHDTMVLHPSVCLSVRSRLILNKYLLNLGHWQNHRRISYMCSVEINWIRSPVICPTTSWNGMASHALSCHYIMDTLAWSLLIQSVSEGVSVTRRMCAKDVRSPKTTTNTITEPHNRS